MKGRGSLVQPTSLRGHCPYQHHSQLTGPPTGDTVGAECPQARVRQAGAWPQPGCPQSRGFGPGSASPETPSDPGA